MLLREFTVDNHTISLIQDGAIYIARVSDSVGEKVFSHEYKGYDGIKICFDKIIKMIETGNTDIQKIISILERGTV